MCFIIISKNFPSLRPLRSVPQIHPAFFEPVVILPAHIDRPAHPVGLENKTADIHVGMTGSRRSHFNPHIQSVRIVPAGTH